MTKNIKPRVILQAIHTTYRGPAARRGSRIIARAYAGSVSSGAHQSSGDSSEAKHRTVAMELVAKMGWDDRGGEWVQGGDADPKSSGYYFVWVATEGSR